MLLLHKVSGSRCQCGSNHTCCCRGSNSSWNSNAASLNELSNRVSKIGQLARRLLLLLLSLLLSLLLLLLLLLWLLSSKIKRMNQLLLLSLL